MHKKVALVLSGGGLKGAAHIGAYKAMESFDIDILRIAGTSAGALVGAMIAAGFDSTDCLKIWKEQNFLEWKKLRLPKKLGLVDSEYLIKQFSGVFPVENIEQLNIPFTACATDLLEGKSTYFSSGNLVRAILGSAAFPGVITPVQHDGSLFADGGILNNFPIEPLIGKAPQLLGVFLNPASVQKLPLDAFSNTVQVLDRAYHLALAKDTADKFKQVHYLVCPSDLVGYKTFSSGKTDELYQIGYDTTCRMLENRLK